MNPITTMREILGENGENWTQQTWQDDEGHVCLSGAASIAVGATPEPLGYRTEDQKAQWGRIKNCIVRIANDIFPRYTGFSYIGFISINDGLCRTWSDIDLILKHAERAWDEEPG